MNNTSISKELGCLQLGFRVRFKVACVPVLETWTVRLVIAAICPKAVLCQSLTASFCFPLPLDSVRIMQDLSYQRRVCTVGLVFMIPAIVGLASFTIWGMNSGIDVGIFFLLWILWLFYGGTFILQRLNFQRHDRG